jgi:hypothetical protein
MCDKFQNILNRLAEYEDLEEQELLLHLPCKIGDDIYTIPSEINYLLNLLSKKPENNRVYHQNIISIQITKNGWYVQCDKDNEYGTGRTYIDKFFGIEWFLSQEEAEKELKRLGGSNQ